MDLKDFSGGPAIPSENIPAGFMNALLMNYAELRTIRAQLSHFLQTRQEYSGQDLESFYAKEAEKVFDETWASILAKLGK